MLSTEESIQKTVLSLEAGKLARWVRRGAFVLGIVTLSLLYLMVQFRGLAASQAMDQAQIGRELLRGNGFATKFVRPLAIAELKQDGRDFKKEMWVDTYNAPIPCLLDAAAIYFPVVKWNLELSRHDLVYAGDRAIAVLQVLCFLGSLALLYLLAKELFDERLARIACGLMLVCNSMWQYALSGLPQMWLLLLLTGTLYLLARGMRARYLNERVLGWMAGAGLGFGLLALSHALTLWLFVPALIFSVLFFPPRPWPAAVMLAVFMAVYTPWLVRNARVSGDYRGLAIQSILEGVDHSEAGRMRRMETDVQSPGMAADFAVIKGNLIDQLGRLIEYLGWSLAAPVAFVSLLHAFKRPVTGHFRWLVMFMWLGAALGMAVFGMKEDHGVAANQLHLLFVPIFACYGMAYLLVQWDRRIGLGFLLPQWEQRSNSHKIVRNSLVVLIFVLSGLPMVSFLFSTPKYRVQWPPYLPSSISLIHQMMKPNEVVGSDMPWAVAWYADRKSLWLPYQPSDLLRMSDFGDLGGPVSALYFTPVSGMQNTLGDLVSGDYRFWTAYVVRTVDKSQSPYHWQSPLATGECVIYADTDRSVFVTK